MPSPEAPVTAVQVEGDAVVLLTAPFFPLADPLVERPACRLPPEGPLDDSGRFEQVRRPLDALLRGSLTYGRPSLPALTHFAGTDALCDELVEAAGLPSSLDATVAVRGVLFSDGYGSVAVHVAVPGGWDALRRDDLLATFGPAGRERTAAAVRRHLLPPLAQMSRRCGQSSTLDVDIPYFNQTYVGETGHEAPGRAPLADALRELVYPRSAAPTTSHSPWYDEFFYAGYAFNLLACDPSGPTLEKLELLLLHLDVLYARLARSADAADEAVRGRVVDRRVDWLVQLELRLRADYQNLVTPTFSFDHHVLQLRDAVLEAWDTDALHARTESLLGMVRETVERRLALAQARRLSIVNWGIAVLTAISVVATADAALSLWDRLS